MGLEETGRKVRQEAFSRAEADYFGKSETADLQGGGRVSAAREGKLRIRIALAHNENDVAETLLHNLCRGTGLKGLASILPVRDDIIRPVLCLNKQEIVNYLIKEQIPYVTDSTNLTDDYTRNQIRHQIFPLLEEQVNQLQLSAIWRRRPVLLVRQRSTCPVRENASCEKVWGRTGSGEFSCQKHSGGKSLP